MTGSGLAKDSAPITVLRATRETSTEIRRAAVVSDATGVVAAVRGRPALIVVSPTVNRLYAAAIGEIRSALGLAAADVMVVPTGEHAKSLASVERIVNVAGERGLARDGVIVGIGGGILLDMVGLAAGLFRRGVSHIKIGTTLIAQVDAAVGLKCGVNSGGAKNIAGAFNPPEATLTDGAFLATLPPREIRCGIAEILKLAVAGDGGLFELLEQHGALLLEPGARDTPEVRAIVDRAIRGMVDELASNPFESDLRRRVDFGHTVSGIFEVETGHRLAHGEAVALDVMLFSAVSVLRGSLDRAAYEMIVELAQRFGLQTWHPVMADLSVIERGLDDSARHRGRKLNLPLPSRIGGTYFVAERAEISSEALRDAVDLVAATRRVPSGHRGG
ncbi:sedoheptulose 7-phosphate cyclase [Gordonia crocea]|uniref:2-epi-5-epi-valiolone synthase n=1 Tax=Gordonia crocea TaxID=589162 RepID=A0A7I9V0H9_9ACTN|nr:sedoheptulose 7-phosphate cyclase [Gordonia crocea]GED98947.1 3-dehydroquinate synthase [Gordonia crocea]